MNKIKFNTVIICMDLFYFPIMLYHNVIILFITTIAVAKQHLTVKTQVYCSTVSVKSPGRITYNY